MITLQGQPGDSDTLSADAIEAMIAERKAARADGDYADADRFAMNCWRVLNWKTREARAGARSERAGETYVSRCHYR